jgi:lipopolysaccharide export system permease protein
MKVLQRYFATELLRAILFVLLAFLMLFAFFDLLNELREIGRGGYTMQYALLYILLGFPGYAYELMPIAVLIGTVWVLSQFASRSEFTIMRAAGMSAGMAGRMLAEIAVGFALMTFLLGEFVAPRASDYAEKLKLSVQGTSVSQEFRSGLWAKDIIKEGGMSGRAIGTRFLNVRDITPAGQLRDLTIYEFDSQLHMNAVITAEHADYRGNNVWNMVDVTETRFSTDALNYGRSMDKSVDAVATRQWDSRELISEVTPDIVTVVFADPDRMSAYQLWTYTEHLRRNRQEADRYEIAFWKKITYPLAVFVMMALALPFAYMHVRSGGVSLKIFIGIMIGVSFQLFNSLFAHIGLLNTWPAPMTALLPSGLFLLAAMIALWRAERH